MLENRPAEGSVPDSGDCKRKYGSVRWPPTASDSSSASRSKRKHRSPWCSTGLRGWSA